MESVKQLEAGGRARGREEAEGVEERKRGSAASLSREDCGGRGDSAYVFEDRGSKEAAVCLAFG